MLLDFARYYQIAKDQGNHEAAKMIKAVILSILDDDA